MYSMVTSGAMLGMQAYLVSVEVDIAPGLPGFSIVGSLSCEVRESRERVAVALKNVGLRLPPTHVTVNLSPADLRKEGTAFDLPIAVGMLRSMEYFSGKALENTLFLGELGLNGEIKKVRGVLPIIREAAKQGIRQCIVPEANATEGAVVPEVTVRGAKHISQLLAFLKNTENPLECEKQLPAARVDAAALFQQQREQYDEDFAEVKGQETARRAAEIAAAGFHNLLMTGPPGTGNALFQQQREQYDEDFAEVKGQETARRAAEIAAAGFHNLLMTGPPGTGKSMIAKRILSILPPLTMEESLEVTSVASVAGTLQEGSALVTERPFVSPHHTASQPAMLGGSSSPRPGMISLAHRGVLFLDELPEFKRQTLDSLRQPLEERRIHISRVWGNVTFPSDFMLVCAMNPCPCGYYPDKNKCTCTRSQLHRYLGKISGPILDRFDLCIQLQQVELSGLWKKEKSESSACIRKRVEQARERQKERFAGSSYRFNGDIRAADMEKYCSLGAKEQKLLEELYSSLQGSSYRFNGDIRAADMEKYCSLGAKEQKLLEELYSSLQLSVRACHRILRVARTIADLEGTEAVEEHHLLEAVLYRPDKSYWSA